MLVLKDVGRDSNVLLSNRSPESDFTATLNPSVLGAVRFGPRAYVQVKAGFDYVWYQHRSILDHTNIDTAMRGNVDLTGWRGFAAASYQRHDERPSTEFDERARRTNSLQRAGLAWEPSSATAIDVILTKEKISYADSDFAYPSPGCPSLPDCRLYTLGHVQDRTETTRAIRMTRRILGRTQLVVEANRKTYDFRSELAPLSQNGERALIGSIRDSESDRFLGGFELDRGGLVWGGFRAGVNDYHPRFFRGQKTREVIGSTNLNWRLGSRFSLHTEYDRDLQFSVFQKNLYYLQDHALAQVVYYLSRIVGFETGYETWRLRYPTDTFSLGTPRRDEIRSTSVGLKLRLANRTTATLRVAGRRRDTNIPGADDRQVLVTTGVETTF